MCSKKQNPKIDQAPNFKKTCKSEKTPETMIRKLSTFRKFMKNENRSNLEIQKTQTNRNPRKYEIVAIV